MSDTFTEVTSQSWFGRIGGSIKGIVAGLIFIPLSILLLFWNESRAVTTARSLAEGAASVVSVPPDEVSPGNEGKLIHLSGPVTTDQEIQDPLSGLSGGKALRLSRRVEMYQWKEDKSTETHKKLGGGEETITKYTYQKEWSDKVIDSSRFKQAGEHANPSSLPVEPATTVNPHVTLGAFQIPASLVRQMSGDEPLPPTEEAVAHLPANLRSRARLSGQSIYLGNDEAAPAIGDGRMTFQVLPPATFSLLSQQAGTTLQPYQTKAGDSLERVESGSVSAAQMFQHAASENAVLTWILRLVGFIVMFIGFAMIFKPLSVLADVVPFIGGIVGFGTGLLSFFLALGGSLIVIAIAWVVVRPVLGITLLVLAAGALIFGFARVRKHHQAVLAAQTVPAAA